MRDKVLLQFDPGPSGEPEPGTHRWQHKQTLRQYLSMLPVTLLRLLHSSEGGYLVLWDGDTGYYPGRWHGTARDTRAVAFLNVTELNSRPEAALTALAQLVDHLLGSCCREPAAYITEGSSVSPHWSGFHQRLVTAEKLGYPGDEWARESPTAYFRWAFARYCADRQKLSTVDPQAYRLMHSTVFSESHWRGHPLCNTTAATE